MDASIQCYHVHNQQRHHITAVQLPDIDTGHSVHHHKTVHCLSFFATMPNCKPIRSRPLRGD
ncbi:hypothetical protein RvY_02638 [Ramazzottius varieornatus]|uniref:Uncharacterized protein n=1 Tax=Ramazzottius varieornatus TaxID=947166 RepID=A0A1D1UUY5_RAMVA|nr:hypothetical protein RvY_02638 [Ramazzottius varieornatus]